MSALDVEVLRALDRSARWTLESSVDVRTDVGHPQGLQPWGSHWLVSTVHGDGRGELLVVDTAGEVVQRRDVTDGERFHPGGISSGPERCWVPVAEYRPSSTTTVVCVDADLSTLASFRFDDHLGAVGDLGDGTLLAVSWGSRTLYRLDLDGASRALIGISLPAGGAAAVRSGPCACDSDSNPDRTGPPGAHRREDAQMTAKKKGSGRATPKGTKNPTKTGKPKRTDLPEPAAGALPREVGGRADRVGKQSGKVSRPMSHNRGNR